MTLCGMSLENSRLRTTVSADGYLDTQTMFPPIGYCTRPGDRLHKPAPMVGFRIATSGQRYRCHQADVPTNESSYPFSSSKLRFHFEGHGRSTSRTGNRRRDRIGNSCLSCQPVMVHVTTDNHGLHQIDTCNTTVEFRDSFRAHTADH